MTIKDFEEDFKYRFQKVISDEISASILYQRIANELVGDVQAPFRSEMAQHSSDEKGHFDILLKIAADFQIPYTVEIRPEVALREITDYRALMMFTQELEMAAIEDYTYLVNVCRMTSQFYLMDLFQDILNSENEHYNDIQLVSGGKTLKLF